MQERSYTKWVILVLSLVSILLRAIDVTAVYLILSPISMQLDISIDKVQWIVNTYILTFAAFIISGGRLGEIIGIRKCLLIGITGFMVGSFFNAITDQLSVMIVGRLIQGLSAALMSPNAIAIVYQAFPLESRGFLSGVVTSTIGAAMAIGPLLGGVLTYLYSWRLVFFINIPFGLLAIFLTIVFVQEDKKQHKPFKYLDIKGLTLLTILLFSMFIMIDNATDFMSNIVMLAVLSIVFIGALIAFIFSERASVNPIYSVELFKNKDMLLGCAMRFLFSIPIGMLLFFFALYLQHAGGYSTLQAGLMYLPLTIIMIFLSPIAGKRIDKLGHRKILNIGILVSILSFLGLSFTQASSSLMVFIFLFALSGVGIGLTRPAIMSMIMKLVPQKQLGIATGIFNMLYALGNAFGIAIPSLVMSIFATEGTTESLITSMPIVMYLGIVIMVLTLIPSFLSSKLEKS